MARGTVITARGQALNMEELILSAKRPMSMKGVDQKDKVGPKKQPARQLNVRGFIPSASGVATKVQNVPALVEHVEPEDEIVGRSLADLTAVNLRGSKRLKERPTDATQVANEALREIMGDLEHFKSREPVEPPVQQRRTRKAS